MKKRSIAYEDQCCELLSHLCCSSCSKFVFRLGNAAAAAVVAMRGIEGLGVEDVASWVSTLNIRKGSEVADRFRLKKVDGHRLTELVEDRMHTRTLLELKAGTLSKVLAGVRAMMTAENGHYEQFDVLASAAAIKVRAPPAYAPPTQPVPIPSPSTYLLATHARGTSPVHSHAHAYASPLYTHAHAHTPRTPRPVPCS